MLPILFAADNILAQRAPKMARGDAV